MGERIQILQAKHIYTTGNKLKNKFISFIPDVTRGDQSGNGQFRYLNRMTAVRQSDRSNHSNRHLFK